MQETMYMAEGIVTSTPVNGQVAPNEQPSIWDSAFGWFSDTVGTYANNARDQFFAREGIARGEPQSTIQADPNAKGDITARTEESQPLYKEPAVLIGAGLVVVVGLIILLVKK